MVFEFNVPGVYDLLVILLSTNGGLELVPKYISKVSVSPSGSDDCQERVGVVETPVASFDGEGY